MSLAWTRLLFLASLLLVGFSSLAAVPEPSPVKCSHQSLLLDEDFPPPPDGDRGFDVLSYDLAFRLDSVSSRITGTVAVGLASLVQDLALVQLDLVDELTCEGVTAGGISLSYTHQEDALLISLPAPLAPGEIDTLHITWQGQPPRHGQMRVGLLFRHHSSGTGDDPTDDVPIIANISEPWSAHSWWPCKDHPADKALVSVAVTVPDTLSVVGNGTLMGVDEVEPGWRRYRWREDYPLATYLVSVAASNYETWTEDCFTPMGQVPLEFFVFPQDRVDAEHDFAPTCAMMEFMEDMAGPYPFAGEKYAQVEIKWTGAMEHTTATSISQILLTGDGRFENLILHELAHQWFGDSLTPGVWADIWLNEGFARYCEALWVEHAYGSQAYREFMSKIGVRRHPTFFDGDGVLIDPDPILPNILVYDKGAWLLHSLRLLMGDGPFFDFLKSYATSSHLVQGTVRLADMVAEAESWAGRDLTRFFDPWLETEAVPQLWYETQILAGQPESARVTFHQLQDPVFEMAVPVRLDTQCGSEDRLARITRVDQVFQWILDCPVEAITIDPDSLVFMFRGKAPPPALQVRGPRPNPMGQGGGQFDIYIIKQSQVTVKLYDARGRNLAEFDLGSHEATGPADDDSSAPVVWTFLPETVEPETAAGVYWLEFKAEADRAVRKLTLVK